MYLHCGNCQKTYEMHEGMIGQPDLEGIFIRILGKNIQGTDINICPKCAIYALSGTHGFKRKGNSSVVFANNGFQRTKSR